MSEAKVQRRKKQWVITPLFGRIDVSMSIRRNVIIEWYETKSRIAGLPNSGQEVSKSTRSKTKKSGSTPTLFSAQENIASNMQSGAISQSEIKRNGKRKV